MKHYTIKQDLFQEAKALIDANLQAAHYVYFLTCREVDVIKIGFASVDWRKRIIQNQTGSPVELQVLAVVPGTLQMEQSLHQIFREYRSRNEWFHANPELRALTDYAASLKESLQEDEQRRMNDALDKIHGSKVA